MKKSVLYPRIVIVCLALGLAAMAAWAFRKEGPRAPAGAASHAAAASSADVLDSLPATSGKTLSDQAVAHWVERARQAPDDDKAWSNLGDALMQKARETADVAYYGHAERAYQQALVVNPRSVPALNGMAWVNGGRHEFEKSLDWAGRAAALDPQDNAAYGLMGDADVEMGNYDQAYAHYQQMLDVRPDISSYSRGAHLLWLTGDTRKALWLMMKAVKTGAPYAENTAWCRAQIGLMLYNDGALLPADQVLKASLKVAPHNYQLLAAMGKVKAAERQYPAAINYYKQAIAVVPLHDSVVALGDLYRVTGRPQEAERQYALVEVIHRLMQANGVRGDWQVAQFDADHDRNLPEALRMVQEEYKTRPNVYVADTLAWCLYKNGRYAEAQAAVRKSLSRHTPEAGFLFHAGMIAAKLGQRSAAQMDLYRAVSLNPNFSLLYAPVAAATLKQLGSRTPEPPKVAAR
ncbi:MAG: tetratricopeptide repeat protein [Armatimonadetes bacterium]|nr:tetratricopeptide repeat protein [Armatimonadota bacterium]